jgi:uncharacterized membrane protein
MIKPYRYIIYKIQSWSLNKSNDTPIANAIITLSFVHFLILFTIYLILLKYLDIKNVFSKDNKFFVGLFLAFFFIAHYFLFYNKKKWSEYLEEFENETWIEKKRGNIYVISYFVGSIILFFSTLILLFNK